MLCLPKQEIAVLCMDIKHATSHSKLASIKLILSIREFLDKSLRRVEGWGWGIQTATHICKGSGAYIV